MIDKQQAQQILKCRQLSKDTLELQSKREAWLDKLNIICWSAKSTKKEKIPNMDSKYNSGRNKLGFDERIKCDNEVKVLEIYQIGDKVLETTPENYQFFNSKYNTRTKINSETCFEIDKLPREKAFGVVCEVILSLINKEFHFAVFYAKGQRSPHIRIYDFEELSELNPKQRIKAQIDFWVQHSPFGFSQFCDNGMFVDSHNLQLEFAPHYKYNTPFELLFEWLPEKETKEEIKENGKEYKLFFDGGIKFNEDRKKGKIASAYVLLNPSGEIISKDCKIEDNSTTPKAEYKGLILGLQELEKRDLDNVEIAGDSQLIINQVLGKYRCDNESLKEFYEKAKSLMKNNKLKWIPREENQLADQLIKEALKPFRK